jgi:Ca2+-transporting ATPase
MGNASVICADKTGTLTQNEMTVVAGSIGVHAKFVRKSNNNCERTSNGGTNARDFAVDLSNLDSAVTPRLAKLVNDAIAVNSTAFEDVNLESGAAVFIGSKTETALLEFAKELGWASYKVTREAANVIQMIPFSSDRKSMGCVVQFPDGNHRLYIKGASEILTRKCTRYVVVPCDAANSAPSGKVETAPIGESEEDDISRTISSYASQTLHTVALCYRDFSHWPPKGVRMMVDNKASGFFPTRTLDA